MAAATTAFASVSESPLVSQDSSLADDPLFLHHGENPGVLLISQPLIGAKITQLGLDLSENP